MTPRSDNWLSVDRQGLRQVLAQKGAARVLMEIVSNALDTEAKVIEISFAHSAGNGVLQVEDDDPKGFSSLVDSYTLFAPSTRKGDASKRGRFGLGDKEVLALCSEARIVSTSGTVIFDEKGRRQTATKRRAGSEITATVEMDKKAAKEFEALVRQVIIPPGVKVSFNGNQLDSRSPLRTFTVSLPTVLSDADGNLKPTTRKATVELFEVAEGADATIFELGMPVVEHEGRWHVNIGQKVPLNSDRDNVPPSYLRKLRTAVLDNTIDLIDNDDANSVWVKDAFISATPEAQREVIKERFGAKVVAFDPSDLEANKRAAEEGYTVVGGRSLSKDEWAVAKGMDLIPAAGKVLPSGIKRDGTKDNTIKEADWTPGMQKVIAYAREMSQHLLGFEPTVVMERAPLGEKYAATWGGRTLTFNLTTLGHRWFDTPSQTAVDALLIHEFAHHFALDHLSERFYSACCDLGAKLRTFTQTL